MKFNFYLPLLSIICFDLIKTENDGTTLDELCYSTKLQNERKLCNCIENSSPPYGLQSLKIDCNFRNFKTNDLPMEFKLPLNSEILDLSWNKFETIPFFVSESLQQINLMHNNLSKILNNNFLKLTNLQELYLRWNGIQIISQYSFTGLDKLKILDLSHNNLKELSSGSFTELLSIETLYLSWNRYLYQTVKNISSNDIYKEFGINLKLKILNLEMCGLKDIYLPSNAIGLIQLNLRNNFFKNIPKILPINLKELDLSENPIRSLIQNETKNLPKSLNQFLIEDMPELEIIDNEAFIPLIMLKKLSVQNSRNLIQFHELAFGLKSTTTMIASQNSLESLNLRGTGLRKLNSTLLKIFSQLEELHLNGNPLICDCELLWLKQLSTLNENVKCFKPNHLRGMSIKNIPDIEFVCDKNWPNWIQNGVIFLFIISFAILIITIVVMLKPQRNRIMMRQRVGAGSPYARITIEPNRRENNF